MKIPVRVVSQAEAEKADVILCVRRIDMPVGFFADDCFALCEGGCGFEVRHRPTVPNAPPKICMQCARTLKTIPARRPI